MNRKSARLVYVPVLGIAALITWQQWDSIVALWDEKFPDDGFALAIAQSILLFFAIVLTISFTLDQFFPDDDVEVAKETVEEKRKLAETAALAAIKGGMPAKALAIYENAGMLVQALDLAHTLNDKESQGRLFARLGKYDKAFRLWHGLGNHEEAARCATLGGDITRARESYRTAAEAAEKRGAKAAELAGLWDRAGEYAKAAPLYENAGDLFRAAECFDFAKEEAKAAKMREQGNVIKAYERSRGINPDADPDHRAALAKAARIELQVGDFLAAALHFREAGEYVQAAEVFESYQEYDRAASAYESGGLNEKAEAMRKLAAQPRPGPQFASVSGVVQLPPGVNSDPIPAPKPPEAAPPSISRQVPLPQRISKQVPLPQILSSPAPNAPQPALPPAAASSARISVSGIQRQPLAATPIPLRPAGTTRAVLTSPPPPVTRVSQQELHSAATQYVPVYVVAAPDGRIMTSTSQGDIDWVARALRSEEMGEFQNAADLYRQIGQFGRAGECLMSAGRPAEAALFNVAIGHTERAVRLLTEELEKHPDVELGELLGELYIDRGHYFKAMELLCSKLAPGGISESNADLFYRFAQKFEARGAANDALYLYREILASGALSEDVTERVKRLERALGPDARPPHVPVLKSRRSPSDFLKSIIDTSSSSNNGHADAPLIVAPAEAPRAFPFLPKSLPKAIMRDGKAVRETYAPKRGLSLFAPPEQADEHTAATSVFAAGVQAPLNPSSPYAPAIRYAIKREIARGGMGVVYEATDTALGRDVALKLLQNTAAEAEELQQFLMEARAIARLNHPSVVAIYDIGLMDLRHYIAMEMVRGTNLRESVVRSKKLPLGEALRYLSEIAGGLHAAHESGIIHRDIKPANILLNEKDAVKIADFGLAKLARAEGEESDEKTIFKTAGTPGYMAPEQIEGGEIGPQADIYALGVSLFFMLVGQTPAAFSGRKMRHDIFEMQLSGSLPKLQEACPELPESVAQIYQYCTERDPAKRYSSIGQFLPTIETWRAKLTSPG